MVQSWFYRKKSVWQELRAGLTRTALAVCLGVAFVLGGCKNGGFSKAPIAPISKSDLC